jgi:thiol-disulfide isomerase/thioredoxin
VLKPELPVETQGKIEVLEFFWYGCPHCYSLEPLLETWLKKLPADIQFKRVPAVFNERWAKDAAIFYALEASGNLERLHRPLFDAIHRDRLKTDDGQALGQWLAKKRGRHQEVRRGRPLVQRAEQGAPRRAAFSRPTGSKEPRRLRCTAATPSARTAGRRRCCDSRLFDRPGAAQRAAEVGSTTPGNRYSGGLRQVSFRRHDIAAGGDPRLDPSAVPIHGFVAERDGSQRRVVRQPALGPWQKNTSGRVRSSLVSALSVCASRACTVSVNDWPRPAPGQQIAPGSDSCTSPPSTSNRSGCGCARRESRNAFVPIVFAPGTSRGVGAW